MLDTWRPGATSFDEAGFSYELGLWSNLTEEVRKQFFVRPPERIPSSAGRKSVLAAMGGTLYLPASRPDLSRDLARLLAAGVTSVIVDLEDSVGDESLVAARANLCELIRAVGQEWAGRTAPIALFVRVRTITEMQMCLDLDGITAVAGFVVPKCDGALLREYASALTSQQAGDRLMLMPVVETVEFARATTRLGALAELAEAIFDHRERVLAVRFGSVDLAGAYGARLDAGMSVYDVPFLAATLGDLVSVVSATPTLVPVVGSVHEYYRESPRPTGVRSPVPHGVSQLPGLTREVLLDRAAGLWSKSVVHPVQALIVNALAAVTWGDYRDATSICAIRHGGVEASHAGQRMNEGRPHAEWAAATLIRAQACGVLHEGVRAADLLERALEVAFPDLTAMRTP